MKFRECFSCDSHRYNPVPKNWLKGVYVICFSQRYSMSLYLRLTEYFYEKYKKRENKLYLVLADFFKRKNEVVNQFEHGYEHKIAPGTLFHHTGVTLNSNVVIKKNVQIFKNVTLAYVNGRVCEIGEGSVIFSHVIILGKKIGENCVIGAGSVVTRDIPDNSVVAGNPGKIIDVCDDASAYLEYR